MHQSAIGSKIPIFTVRPRSSTFSSSATIAHVTSMVKLKHVLVKLDRLRSTTTISLSSNIASRIWQPFSGSRSPPMPTTSTSMSSRKAADRPCCERTTFARDADRSPNMLRSLTCSSRHQTAHLLSLLDYQFLLIYRLFGDRLAFITHTWKWGGTTTSGMVKVRLDTGNACTRLPLVFIYI